MLAMLKILQTGRRLSSQCFPPFPSAETAPWLQDVTQGAFDGPVPTPGSLEAASQAWEAAAGRLLISDKYDTGMAGPFAMLATAESPLPHALLR